MPGHVLDTLHVKQQDPVQVLGELKRLAVEQLGSVPGALFQPIEEALHAMARNDQAGGRQLELAALLQLRQRGSAYVMRYRQLVAQGFDQFRALPLSARADGLPLGLVEDRQLDYHLAGQRLAESIGKRYEQPLKMLDARMECLSRALDQPPSSNPIGAARLAGVFINTFRDAELPESLRPLLFRQYEHALSVVLGDLYGRVNTLLSSAGYAAGTRATGTEQPAERTVLPGPSRMVADGTPDAGARRSLGELRERLHAWRNGVLDGCQTDADAAPARRMPERRALGAAEVASVASLLQADPPEPYVRALAGGGQLAQVIRDQLSDGARRLGIDPDHTRLDENEEDAIDLVAMLFESLFRTHALLDRSRRLYARLVMPYLKVALKDDDLFLRRNHPARQLLDAITEACEGNDGINALDRELLERAAAASQRIVADYQEDLEIFQLAHAELDALLDQHRARAQAVERRASEAVHGRERLLQARLQAATALGRRLGAAPLTAAVGEFLVQHWQHHVVQVLLRDGLGSERHGEALALGDALVDVDRAAAQAPGAAVADHLIALQPAFADCLASSGLDEQAAHDLFAGLVRVLADPDAERIRHDNPRPQIAEDEPDAGHLALAGGTDTLDYDPAVAERMRRLVPGDWVRLHDAQGEASSAKIAWISPLTARFLLVNRRGVRVLVASAEQLAELSAAGRLVVDAEAAPFDEAMRAVHARLDRAVGQD
ncbi:DUF1631 domain-containing protein [Luteimonas pelagia]